MKKKRNSWLYWSHSIAELTYVVVLNLIHNKNIEVYILNMPCEKVSSYDEVKFWLDDTY